MCRATIYVFSLECSELCKHMQQKIMATTSTGNDEGKLLSLAVRDIHARAMTWPVAAQPSGLGHLLCCKELGRSWLVLPLLAPTQLTAC